MEELQSPSALVYLLLLVLVAASGKSLQQSAQELSPSLFSHVLTLNFNATSITSFTCPDGYQLSATNGTCININECLDSTFTMIICPLNSVCIDLLPPAMYECQCLPGFTLQQNECIPVDMCADCLPASQGGICNSSSCCSCAPGWTGDGISHCYDINECHEQRPCQQGCSNLPGSYFCYCYPGFMMDDEHDAGICQDIDECATLMHNCDQICTNKPGSFTCGCFYGFKLQADGKTCRRWHQVYQT